VLIEEVSAVQTSARAASLGVSAKRSGRCALAIPSRPPFGCTLIISAPRSDTGLQMNKRGNPQSLVASHPGNLNAAKQGVHSPRLIQARAAEIAGELTQSFEFSPAERLAVQEAARCIAILEAIDRDLDQRGLVDKDGTPRYLLNHRSRTSRQLEQWLERVSAAIERNTASEPEPPRADFPDYVRALQRIALGNDTTATARDQLAALKELLKLGFRGTTSYLERPGGADLTRRSHAIHEAKRRRDLERQEESLDITD
jgi:hypothetical protein